ncbi:hypothetical protein Tco_0326728 [Tanacetum coccineum]
MLIPFRGRFLVRGGFVTSVSLLLGRGSARLGLVPAYHILAASICLIEPGPIVIIWFRPRGIAGLKFRYITAYSISEASIRSDLQFNDAAGIDVLSNQAIFDTIQLMGFSLFGLYGKKLLGNVTPLFPSMLVQPIEDEGAVSKRPSETPTHTFFFSAK